MNEIVVKGSDIIILAILVLAVGNGITQKFSLLRKFSIPIAVTGGLLCSIAVALIATFGGPKIVFDLTIRDTLLMVFFTTIGISAKFSRLAAGGKSLGLLVLCAAIFLVVQDATGVLLAKAFGVHPGLDFLPGAFRWRAATERRSLGGTTPRPQDCRMLRWLASRLPLSV